MIKFKNEKFSFELCVPISSFSNEKSFFSSRKKAAIYKET